VRYDTPAVETLVVNGRNDVSERTVRLIKIALLAGSAMVVAAIIAAIGTFVYLRAELPTLNSVADYAPPEATHVFSDDGDLVADLFVERRTVVPIAAIPPHVVHAFLAAEDANFYNHKGLDYFGILRAVLKNLRPGAHLQGASTITQQTVKTLVLGPERSYTRKLREAMLAREMEQVLSKDDILHIYLNQIYFGSGAYGVEQAAQTYFGKSIRQVDLGEAALLASIPKNPSHYTPAADPAAAKQRQRYVLEQMVANGWAEAAEAQKALEAPVAKTAPPPKYLGVGPHYVEHVKNLLIAKYGEEKVMRGGLTVYTGMNARMQAAAHQAVRNGLENLARGLGYAGPRLRLEVDRLAVVSKALHAAFDERRKKQTANDDRPGRPGTVVWDLGALTAEALSDESKVGALIRTVPLEYGQRLVGLVDKVDALGGQALVDLGSQRARLDFKGMQWARRYSAQGTTPPPRDPADVVARGDLVVVDIADVPAFGLSGPRGMARVELVPEPKNESALVAIDPRSRLVRAIVGGYRADAGGFNRAILAKRQPGSAFKPFVYGAGLLANAITPASPCADTPIIIRDPWTSQAWKPENYEDGRYDGNITYRTALLRSKNTCSVKLIEKVGPEQVIAFAQGAGITSPLPQNLTLALGTGDLTPLELANGYSTIASGGFLAEPIFVRKVVDHDGQVLEENRAELTEAIKPAVAYVLTQMMRSVVEEGTATKALVLDRPLAGKTGTSNESRNVWFAGFSAELVAVVWVGYDDNSPMGHATGGSTALPIWVNFMGAALAGVPVREFTPPPDVVFVRVDADTGEPSDDVGSIEEAFIAGTEPTKQKQALPSIFIEDDPARGSPD
jgi:penicillin-binding protein 1A